MFYIKKLKIRGNKGLTLIEVLIATVTTVILLAGALVMQHSVRKSYYAVSGQNEVQKNVEEMMGDITGGLQETRGIYICNSTIPADRGDGTAVPLAFYENSSANLISYYVDGSNKLQRGRSTDGGTTWSDNKLADYNDKVDIDSFTLIAYQEDGTTTTTEPRDIRTIEINLTAHQTVAPTIAPGGEIAVTLHSTVNLRKEPLGNITGSVTTPGSGVIIAATGAANFLYTVDSASHNFSFFATPSGTNYGLVARSLMYNDSGSTAISLDEPGEANTIWATSALTATTTRCRLNGVGGIEIVLGNPFTLESSVTGTTGPTWSQVCNGGTTSSVSTNFNLWGRLNPINLTGGPVSSPVIMRVKRVSDNFEVANQTQTTDPAGDATYNIDVPSYTLSSSFIGLIRAYEELAGPTYTERATVVSDTSNDYRIIEFPADAGGTTYYFVFDVGNSSSLENYYIQADGSATAVNVTVSPGKDNGPTAYVY